MTGQKPKLRAYTALSVASILYGCNVVVARVLSPQVPSVALGLMRGVLALVVIFPLALGHLRRDTRPNLRDFGLLAVVGLFGISIPYTTFNLGMKYTTGVNASIIFATIPALTNLLLALGWRVRLSLKALIGIAVSFAGLLFVFSRGSFANLTSLHLSLGDLILFANVTSASIFFILSQRVMARFSPLSLTVYSLFLGSLVLAPYGLWQALSVNWSLSWSGWMLVLYMGPIVGGFAVVLSMEGIKRIGSGQAVIFNNFVPVIGILSSVVLLKEALAFYHFIGFALVLVGVAISLASDRRQTVPVKLREEVH